MSDQTQTDPIQPAMTPFGFPYGDPPNAALALKAARHIIAEEQRWCTGSLIEWPDGSQDDGSRVAPACTNVKVCAIGALVLVCYNGPAIAWYLGGVQGYIKYKKEACEFASKFVADSEDGEPEFELDEMILLEDHKIGKEALQFLSEAYDADPDNRVRRSKFRDTNVRQIVSRIESFNDNNDTSSHLDKVINLFDAAIKLAEAEGIEV